MLRFERVWRMETAFLRHFATFKTSCTVLPSRPTLVQIRHFSHVYNNHIARHHHTEQVQKNALHKWARTSTMQRVENILLHVARAHCVHTCTSKQIHVIKTWKDTARKAILQTTSHRTSLVQKLGLRRVWRKWKTSAKRQWAHYQHIFFLTHYFQALALYARVAKVTKQSNARRPIRTLFKERSSSGNSQTLKAAPHR